MLTTIFNPLSAHDASRHNFASLKNNLNSQNLAFFRAKLVMKLLKGLAQEPEIKSPIF